LLGRYASDDVEIMRRHVRMAKAAGITGFLVSWKHTPQLDERLAKLTTVARTEGFHLGIVYQGLDFSREPLPLQTVRQDLTMFADEYGRDPVYNVFGKPVVIWTGSTRFQRGAIDSTLRDIRRDLLVLGDAKTVKDCETLTPVMDGQAYYWSSVDPARGTSRTKLLSMANAVHRGGGLWLAPVAPGFDARLVGGSKTVPRRSGETLRASYESAAGTNPDAIGVISWNEFSENTHIEPSEKYGTTDLNVLADLLGAGADIQAPVDSSDEAAGHAGLTSWGAIALFFAVAGLLPLTIAISRRRRAAHNVEKLTYEIEHLPRGERS
ncbi:MAG TPA: endo-1,3-alpha-glucanase family glycosylhydrolase, partial [Actinoplanes sp.]|nr:endo-1,3-alpha-glucanase family glycosylhydrolase [Actinoplanes sp.]